jgi:hypothetical protein
MKILDSLGRHLFVLVRMVTSCPLLVGNPCILSNPSFSGAPSLNDIVGATAEKS